jgi:alkaline phosphatase D
MRHDISKISDLDAFERIATMGLKAEHLIPVYPSTTYPGHVSLATGVYPDQHGILHNSFYDSKEGYFNYPDQGDLIDVPPIWVLAEQAGIPAAVFFWVGSETDWNDVGASFRKAPFDESVSEETKIKQITEWLDLDDKARPRLIMSYWDGIDIIAHQEGPTGPLIKKQILRQNHLLRELLNEIDKRDAWDYISLFVVSDHGMTEVSNYIMLGDLIKQSGIEITASSGPAVAHLFMDQKSKVAALSFFSKQANIQAYDKHDLPKSFHLNHPTRTGDIVLITDPPNMFTNNVNAQPKGMHGYSPQLADMKGIFYAIGAAIEPKALGSVHQIDLAPTIADILGIKDTDHMQGKTLSLKNKSEH